MDAMSCYWIAGAVFVLSLLSRNDLLALSAPRPWVCGCRVLA